MTTARQVAELIGAPCVNCHREPCACMTEVLDRRGVEKGGRRRYEYPDGAILVLDELDWPRAEAAGARPPRGDGS